MDRSDIELSMPVAASIVLRPVAAEDEEFLLAVYASTRAAELSQVTWSEGQQKRFIRSQFELQRREYDSRFPDARYDVILVDGHPAGRIWVGSDKEEIRLLDIAVLPEFQKRGVGTFLLRRLIDEATHLQKSLRHMVFVLNIDALRFYERLGFVVFEQTEMYLHMEWRPPVARDTVKAG